VRGKGNKERIVPISIEGRKMLYKFGARHQFDLIFSTAHGGKLSYNNMRRDLNGLMKKLGIELDGSFHCLS